MKFWQWWCILIFHRGKREEERNKRDVSARARYLWFGEDVKRAKLRTGIVPRFDDPSGECGDTGAGVLFIRIRGKNNPRGSPCLSFGTRDLVGLPTLVCRNVRLPNSVRERRRRKYRAWYRGVLEQILPPILDYVCLRAANSVSASSTDRSSFFLL